MEPIPFPAYHLLMRDPSSPFARRRKSLLQGFSRREFIAGSVAALAGSMASETRAADRTIKFGLTPVFLTNDLELLTKLKSYLERNTGYEVQLVQRRTCQEDAANMRAALRASEGNKLLEAAIDEAISRKPKGHDFIIDRRHNKPALSRHMSVTGG